MPSVIASVNNLPASFPDLIQTVLIPGQAEGEWEPIYQCDADSMPGRADFINAASQNINANTWLANLHYDYINGKLDDLHAEVDAVLGIQHPETTE